VATLIPFILSDIFEDLVLKFPDMLIILNFQCDFFRAETLYLPCALLKMTEIEIQPSVVR
jgi:hypothetical protein